MSDATASEHLCPWCHEPVTRLSRTTGKPQIFCCREHFDLWRKANAGTEVMSAQAAHQRVLDRKDNICPYCHEPAGFDPTNGKLRVFCNAEHMRLWKAENKGKGIIPGGWKTRHDLRASLTGRRCHDCGTPTTDYRCAECRRKWMEANGVAEDAYRQSDDSTATLVIGGRTII